MKRIISLLIIVFLIFTTSCSNQSNDKPKLFLLSVSFNYGGTKHSLSTTLIDQDDVINQIIDLSQKRGKDTIIYKLQERTGVFSYTYMDYTDDYQVKNKERVSDDTNFINDIIHILEEIKKFIGKNDTLMFYFAGHGLENDDPDLLGSIMLGTEAIRANFLAPQELSDLLNKVNSNRFVVLDSCYSGKLLHSDEFSGPKSLEEAKLEYFTNFEKNPRTWAIMASGPDEYAYGFSSLGHGIFSYSLLRALGFEENTTFDNKMISVSELFIAIKEEFKEIMDGGKYTFIEQNPHTTGNMFDLILFD